MIGKKIIKNLTHDEKKKTFEDLEILGGAEVARLLDWDIKKVSLYGKRGVLPQPLGHVNSRPVWTKQQIDQFIKGRAQK